MELYCSIPESETVPQAGPFGTWKGLTGTRRETICPSPWDIHWIYEQAAYLLCHPPPRLGTNGILHRLPAFKDTLAEVTNQSSIRAYPGYPPTGPGDIKRSSGVREGERYLPGER